MADDGLGYITELTAADVLFGRGSGPNDHEGNIRFRQLVAERKQEYLATNHRQTKAKIAREIVNQIVEDRGRFLKKVEHFEARRLGIPKGVDAWIVVDDDTVMEKAKQALRQNTNKARGTSPNRGASPTRGQSPSRGVSPVRGPHSPVPNQQYSPVPNQQQYSPVPGGQQYSPVPGGGGQPDRRQPQPMPSFEDLEPLPLGMDNPQMRNSAQAQQLAMMQQQQRILQQQQQQLAQMANIEPTPLGWGSANNDPNQFGSMNPNNNNMMTNAQGMGGWGGQHQQQNMDPPQARGHDMNPVPVQYSNNNNHLNTNWNNRSQNEMPAGAVSEEEEEEEQLTEEQKRERRQKRQSLQVEDLMDSFREMKTGQFSSNEATKMGESAETMGTIEPLGAFTDSTSMSMTSFSSIFTKAMGESTEDMTFPSRGVSRSSSMNDGNRSADNDASMQSMQSIGSSLGGDLSEVWGSRGMSLLDRLVQEERERANQANASGGGNQSGGGTGGSTDSLAQTPRPLGLMEEEPDNLNSLGPSSMSVMKTAFGSGRSGGSADSGDDQGEV